MHCNREIISSRHGIHERLCLDQQAEALRLKKPGKAKGGVAWNKGLTNETSTIVKQISASVSKSKTGKPGHKHTAETKERISKKLSGNNHGGRCKWFEVDGINVQGTWERDAALKFNELGITWIKVRKPWPYSMDGKQRHYTPDFYLPDYDVYLELKGFWWGNDKQKMEHVIEQHLDKRIVIIELEQFKRILRGELVW